MRLAVYRATLADLAECFEARGALAWQQWGLVKAQAVTGSVWAIRNEEGQALVCGGLWPLPEMGHAEAWFIANRKRASPHMRQVLSLIRVTLAGCSYSQVVTVPETRAGERMARLLGFEPKKQWGTLEVWYGDKKKQTKQVGKTPTAAGGGEPAAADGGDCQAIG